jgi:hypothetical protein
MVFADIYPMYLQKAVKKGRTPADVDAVICWLFGYSGAELKQQIECGATLADFINNAPKINENAKFIKGKICGCAVEAIADPFMQKLRYMDKLVDELAKGKPLEQILRNGGGGRR